MTQKHEKLIQVSAIIFVFVLVAVGFALYNLLKPEKQDNRFCLEDSPPPQHLVMLVDRTDNLTQNQQTKLLQIIKEISLDQSDRELRLKKWAKLSLYSFETDTNNNLQLDELFSFCKPPSENDANIWYETPALLQKKFEATFGKNLLSKTDFLINPNTSDYSYIVEAISEAISIREFGNDIEDRKLFLFSDMLQNSPTYSHYNQRRKTLDVDHYLSPNRNQRKLAPQLDGISVVINYLPRDNGKNIQGLEHRRFWQNLLMRLGATDVIIEKGPA